MITKNTIINIAVGFWMILSVCYIGYDVFTKYTIKITKESYGKAQTDTIDAIINEANKGCDGFKVYSGKKEVNLINLNCLKSTQNPQLAPSGK